MRLSSGRRAPRLMSLLPARGGRASSGLFGVTALPQQRSISARPDEHQPAAAFWRDAPSEAIPPSSQMNSNLVETRARHSHLQGITTLALPSADMPASETTCGG
jgi:hypothetical protein